MNSLSSIFNKKPAAGNATTAAAPESPATPTSTLDGFKLPGVTLPSLGLGFVPIGIDSTKNSNVAPVKVLHPAAADSTDPHYSVDQAALLGAMHFPKTWKERMSKQPVILVPPTGLYGGTAYRYNFAKLFNDWEHVNYMWMNIPSAMADWSAKSAEYVAFAIHYVAAMTGQKVALVAWSQGNLACQWTLKYWPSTRNLTNNFISVSADFHGTLIAYPVILPTAPSILNQRYYSNFIRTLRSNGGDSAYVPHTSIYSSVYDEIVQPQSGDGASAYIKDEREVGVLNVDVQQVCPMTIAGGLWGHGSLIYNALTWALAKDAILNGGPARLDRIDLRSVSMAAWAPGLTLIDIEVGFAAMATFMGNCLLFPGKAFTEAPLPDYAQADFQSLGQAPTLTPEQQAIVDKSKKQVSGIGIPSAVNPTALTNAVLKQLKSGKVQPPPSSDDTAATV